MRLSEADATQNNRDKECEAERKFVKRTLHTLKSR